jgi:hypothetical protein
MTRLVETAIRFDSKGDGHVYVSNSAVVRELVDLQVEIVGPEQIGGDLAAEVFCRVSHPHTSSVLSTAIAVHFVESRVSLVVVKSRRRRR